jgi:hypothetical protein
VATTVLAIFLIGWRMVAWRLTVARTDPDSSDPLTTS